MSNVYTLDQNEYLFLHTAFRSSFAWGVQAEFEDEAAGKAAMEAAFASLQDKEYVTWQDEQMYIVPELWSIMNICTAPQQILMSTFANSEDVQDIRFVYWGEDNTIIEDRILPSSSRRLRVLDGAAELAERIKTQIHLDGQVKAVGEAQVLPSEVLEGAQQAAAQGAADVTARLVEAGMDEVSAASLTRAYTSPMSNTVLTRIMPGENGASTSMILIESTAGIWEMHYLDESRLQLVPVDAEIAGQMIAGFCGVEGESE